MQNSKAKFPMIVSAVVLASLIQFPVARAASDIDAKAKDVTRSLVSVEFTIHNENISREESAQGIVVHKDGIILIAGSTIPESLPREWIKDLKVRLPLQGFTSVPATLLGRTQDRQFAFLKTAKPIEAPVFTPGETAPTVLGQEVYSIAMLGKSSGYPTAVGRTVVKAMLDMVHPLANTASFGLTCGNSPMFDMASGKFVGMTIPSTGEAMYIRDPGGRGVQPIELIDEDQGSAYLPANQVTKVFENIPTAPFESKRAWLAVDGLTGVSEDIRTLRGIKQPSGVMIGSVIANEAADKGGVQSQDIVLTVDGKPFSENPVPEMMVQHFARVLEKHQPGDKIVLGVLRDGKQMDIPVTLGTSPKLASEQTHTYSAKVGVVTRDLVFFDAYARRLPQDTKGVMIALVKNGSPAALGSTPLHVGDLVTKVNDESVDNQNQFLAAMKKIESAADQKEAVFVVIQSDGNTQVCHVDLTK